MEKPVYRMMELRDEITIQGIYSLTYQEKGAEFLFAGEAHDFWELIYLDKGFLYLLIDDKGYKVNQGELFFFNRNQHHIVWSDSTVAPCFMTLGFAMEFPHPQLFQHRRFLVGEECKAILKKLLAERVASFGGELSLELGEPKQGSAPFAQQLLKLYLTELLICVYRTCLPQREAPQSVSSIRNRTQALVFQTAADYIREHLGERIEIPALCRHVHVSQSQLNRAFHHQCGMAVGEYLSSQKLQRAKELLAVSGMNVTQVAQALSYSSVHYFSRAFKQKYGMSPRQYSNSIRCQ